MREAVSGSRLGERGASWGHTHLAVRGCGETPSSKAREGTLPAGLCGAGQPPWARTLAFPLAAEMSKTPKKNEAAGGCDPGGLSACWAAPSLPMQLLQASSLPWASGPLQAAGW